MRIALINGQKIFKGTKVWSLKSATKNHFLKVMNFFRANSVSVKKKKKGEKYWSAVESIWQELHCRWLNGTLSPAKLTFCDYKKQNKNKSKKLQTSNSPQKNPKNKQTKKSVDFLNPLFLEMLCPELATIQSVVQCYTNYFQIYIMMKLSILVWLDLCAKLTSLSGNLEQIYIVDISGVTSILHRYI